MKKKLYSIIRSYLLNIYSDILPYIKKAFIERELFNISLIVLWTIGIITTIVILVGAIITKNVALYSAFAILLSAFMASVAMMKSIYFNQQSELKKEKRELYEERMKVFENINTFITLIIQQRKVNFEQSLDFIRSSSRATFLFPTDINDYIQKLYEESINLEYIQKKIENINTARKIVESNAITFTIPDDTTPADKRDMIIDAQKEAEKTKPKRIEELANKLREETNKEFNIVKLFMEEHTSLNKKFKRYLDLTIP